MKPSKTAYATKKKPAKRADGGNPMIDKLLKLKYRINDAYHDRDIDTKSDKLNGLYFSSAHPMYVPHEGNFFLCTEGVDDEGNSYNINIRGQKFRV